MFVKYNGVLRGLQSDSPFLKNTMVQLCCAKAVAAEYQGTAQIFEPANGSISFEEVRCYSPLPCYTPLPQARLHLPASPLPCLPLWPAPPTYLYGPVTLLR